jgi:hypothetical protein
MPSKARARRASEPKRSCFASIISTYEYQYWRKKHQYSYIEHHLNVMNSTGSGFALAPSLTLGAASYQRSIHFWLAAHGTKEAIFARCISWLWSNPAEPTLFGLRIK